MARKSILVLIVSLVSLVGASVWAQSRRDPTVPTTAPAVLSGENVGIRLTGTSDKDGLVHGVLVVKINGRWVDVASPTGVAGAGK